MTRNLIQQAVFALIIATSAISTYAAECEPACPTKEQDLRNALLSCQPNQLRAALKAGADPNYTPHQPLTDKTNFNGAQEWLLRQYWHGAADQNIYSDAIGCLSLAGLTLATHGLALPICLAYCAYGWQRNEHRESIAENPLGPKQPNVDLMPPLLLATSYHIPKMGNWSEIMKMVKMLIDAHADVNATDEFGNSALTHVVYTRAKLEEQPKGPNVEAELKDINRLIALLVLSGANPNLSNRYNYTPLNCADEKGKLFINIRLDMRKKVSLRIRANKRELEQALAGGDFAFSVAKLFPSKKIGSQENMQWLVAKLLREINMRGG